MEHILEVLGKDINPFLNMHGGGVEALRCVDGVLTIRLCGQCSACLSAESTFEDFIKTKLLERCPELKDVVLSNEVDSDIWNFAMKILNREKI